MECDVKLEERRRYWGLEVQYRAQAGGAVVHSKTAHRDIPGVFAAVSADRWHQHRRVITAQLLERADVAVLGLELPARMDTPWTWGDLARVALFPLFFLRSLWR
jgi:hypothetical protein